MKLDIKTILILVAILLTATVGSAYVTTWVFSHRELAPVDLGAIGAGVAGSTEVEWNDELVWVAGSYTVNLQAAGSAISFIKTSVSMRANNKSTLEELERRRIQISDRLITILRTTSKVELDTEEGISNLKRRITDGVNELLAEKGGRILAVYFSELVTQ